MTKKPNALDAFVRSAPTPPTAAAPSATVADPSPSRRAASSGGQAQMIPYRVHPDAHRALKVLAAQDGTSLQAMIDGAVRAYAEQRGVKLP